MSILADGAFLKSFSIFLLRTCVTCVMGATLVMEIYKMHSIEEVFTQNIKNYNIDPDHLFDLILYIPVNNFSVMSGWSSWVETVLSKV